MKYAHILAAFYGRAWALPEGLVLKMQDFLNQQAAGVKWSEEEIRGRIAESNAESGYGRSEHLSFHYSSFDDDAIVRPQRRQSSSTSRKVAIIPVVGVVSHRMNLVSDISGAGGTSIQKLQGQLRQAVADADCKAIILDVDSPGGSVDGVMELASEIYNARAKKPIIAVCNSMACSAAYWLASAATEVVCTPSGQAGSIGVYMIHEDDSKALEKGGIKLTLIKAGKYKAEGFPAEPLSDDARAAFQSEVDAFYSMFVRDVARNRGTSPQAVRDGYGQGRTLLAADALKKGLIDRIATFDEVGARLLSGRTASSIAMSAAKRQLDLMREGATPHASAFPKREQAQRWIKENGTTSSESTGERNFRRRQRQLDLMR